MKSKLPNRSRYKKDIESSHFFGPLKPRFALFFSCNGFLPLLAIPLGRHDPPDPVRNRCHPEAEHGNSKYEQFDR